MGVSRRAATFEACETGGLHEAVAAVREAYERSEPFDACFMDVQMTQMDGPEAAAAIRALEKGAGGGEKRGEVGEAGGGISTVRLEVPNEKLRRWLSGTKIEKSGNKPLKIQVGFLMESASLVD